MAKSMREAVTWLKGSMTFAACSLGILATSLQAEQLRVLTSMPPSFYQPFVTEFGARFPDIEVAMLNKNTNASVDELLRGNERQFDVFWSSSPEAFELLLQNGHLAVSETSGAPEVYSFAYSALGWTQKRAGPAAKTAGWDALLSSDRTGTIAMARPSRSGSTHMMLERTLQVRGWQEGWAYLLELAGNLSTITARSFTVLDGVANGRFDVGLTIDFLAHARTEDNLAFVYGTPVMVTPARIGILAGGNAPAAARHFVDFVISDAGQRLLTAPGIARTPHSASIRAEATAPYHQVLEDALTLNWLEYDAALASERYWAVNALFDAFVFEVFETRREAWRRLRALEGLREAPTVEMHRIRRLLTSIPIGEADVGNEGQTTSGNAFATLSDQQKDSVQAWRAASRRSLQEADSLLRALEKRAAQDVVRD
ncbi:ABC transporter substrate-binding protein [uncultured Shimia sp.]|uniref:ABC transporter substrate-binding protein n=1 Tax=uncultured Shimia sp. TaxID=573152 RepID=UPI00262B8A7E|nr:ABC transporter substrate-binding protein [uncultured Shimia sp.]